MVVVKRSPQNGKQAGRRPARGTEGVLSPARGKSLTFPEILSPPPLPPPRSPGKVDKLRQQEK